MAPRSDKEKLTPKQTRNRAPRPRNGNTVAVGAYLEKLREEMGIAREPMTRKIIADFGGRITMSLSTLGHIEKGDIKGSAAATIDAIRLAVGGDPYDISELWRVELPEHPSADDIRLARRAGEERAIARRKIIEGGDTIRKLAENSTPEIAHLVQSVLNQKELRIVAQKLADDPKALKMILRMLNEG